jgi:predicted acylesterase/phospholipase RssA
MKIIVCPISGGGFPIQLAILSSLCDIGYKPNLALASSGGNVATYVTVASQWSSQHIKRLIKSLNSDFFIKSWTDNTVLSFIPSWAIGFFKDSFFNYSQNGINFFQEHLTPKLVQDIEIWTGTVECSQKRAQLFCNREAKKSCISCMGIIATNKGGVTKDDIDDKNKSWDSTTIKDNYGIIQNTTDIKDGSKDIKTSHVDTKLYGCLEPIYLNGDLKLIAQAALASASIPTMVPAQNINGKLYSDGGVTHASPLTIMKDAINNLEELYNPGLHITYINSFDLEKSDPVSPNYMTSVHNGKITMFEMVQNFCVQDRISGIDLIRHPDIKMYSKIGEIKECKDLLFIEQQRIKTRRSMIEYYPKDNTAIDLKCFKSCDVDKLYEITRKGFKYRLWWIGDRKLFD